MERSQHGTDGSELSTFAINPATPSTLYVGTRSGGVFRSTDSGGTWAIASKGLTSSASLGVIALAVTKTPPVTLYAGTEHGGVFKSTDSGVTWAAANAGLTPEHYILALAIDPATPSTLYHGSEDGVFKSTDAGGTWAASNAGLTGAVQALAIDSTTPATLYAGTLAGVYKSTDSGGAWASANTGLTSLHVTALAIDPASSSTLYAATYDRQGVDTRGAVYKSTDSGGTWAAASTGLAADSVIALAIDPATPSTLYAGVYAFHGGGGVYKSTDAAGTWALTNRGLRNQYAPALVIDPVTPSTLYVAADDEPGYTARPGAVFGSLNFGGIWTQLTNTGWPSEHIGSLALDPTGATTLFAGLARSGVWQLTAPSPLPASVVTVMPIVLDVDTGSAHYTTELALTNVSAADQNVTLTYTPSLGSKAGGGSVSVAAPAGGQQIYPNIISTLRTLGLPIPEASAFSPQGGTLAISCDPPSAGGVLATARTTSSTQAPQPVGRAGLAYAGLTASEAITDRAIVFALRSTDSDRSNLAIYNVGADPVTLRITLFSGAGDGRRVVLSDHLALGAYGWTQFDNLLAGFGMTNAWALLERTSATGAFGAYGVINDRATNDGSFVGPVSAAQTGSMLTLPVLVETGSIQSELVLANRGSLPAFLSLNYVESLSPRFAAGGRLNVALAPGEQRIISGAIDFLRENGVILGPKGAADFAGAVRIEVRFASPGDVYAGARIASPSSAGGQFGAFAPAVYAGQEAYQWSSICGLRADAFSRTNVAVIHAGADTTGPVTLRLDVHDGSAGGAVRRTLTLALNPGQWIQPGGFIRDSGVANSYVTITRIAGRAPWIAYGVVNDGGAPGQRTSDGAYIPMVQ